MSRKFNSAEYYPLQYRNNNSEIGRNKFANIHNKVHVTQDVSTHVSYDRHRVTCEYIEKAIDGINTTQNVLTDKCV